MSDDSHTEATPPQSQDTGAIASDSINDGAVAVPKDNQIDDLIKQYRDFWIDPHAKKIMNSKTFKAALATAIREAIGEDENLSALNFWGESFKNGTTRNKLRAEIREALRQLGLDV